MKWSSQPFLNSWENWILKTARQIGWIWPSGSLAIDNPLPARAFTNRIWKMFFGYGLSRRLEDLGGQGEPPTHPKLLDHLASEFRNSGWDVKKLIRTLVTSRCLQTKLGAHRKTCKK